ncbi:MAG: NYN domain-containing protein, partial [Proteobacteria bacterium]|nr:NYN domain-containing protein [Pseudomonadota bacterium]
PVRQQVYYRALKTVPEVHVFKGTFQVVQKWSGIAHRPPPAPFLLPPPTIYQGPRPDVAFVYKTEEKGSDVNLGAHLVRDAFQGVWDVAVVVTNDTDLCEPIRIVTQELARTVGLICPSSVVAGSLRPLASFVRHMDTARLRSAQFPDTLPGTTITKPGEWV